MTRLMRLRLALAAWLDPGREHLRDALSGAREEAMALRIERDAALAARDAADAAREAADAARTAEFDACERYIAERDQALADAATQYSSARFWRAEVGRVNATLARALGERAAPEALPPGIASIADARARRAGVVALTPSGPA